MKNRSYYQIYQREWDALSWTEQGGICRTFDVIIVDHKIKLERTKKILRMITLENFNNIMKKYHNGLDKFDGIMKDVDKEIKTSFSSFDNFIVVDKKNKWF